MAHYRKIDIRIWLDQKFNALSSDSQFVFLYLLTHPQLTALGAMRSTLPGLAAELGWSLERFEAAFKALAELEMVAVDQKTCFVWAINFLKYNPPESPNVVKSWGTSLEYLPECDLKNQLIQKTRDFLETLPLAFQEALPGSFEFITSLANGHPVTSSGNAASNLSLPLTLSKVLPKDSNGIEHSPQASTNTGLRDTASSDLVLSVTLTQDLLEESHEIKHHPNLNMDTSLNHSASSELALPVFLNKDLVEESHSMAESFKPGLAEGFTKGLPEGFGEAFPKTSLNHRTLNIEHKTISIKQEQEQKEKRLIQENYSEEKLEIEEIKHIVTPARQKNSKLSDVDVVEVFNYWKQTMQHPQAMLDAKRRKRIREALASGYSISQLCEAILGCSYTPHNMGDNEQGQRYDSVHVIFRDADQIDRFIRNAHNPPRLQNAADRLMNTNEAARQRWLEKKRREAEKVIYESL